VRHERRGESRADARRERDHPPRRGRDRGHGERPTAGGRAKPPRHSEERRQRGRRKHHARERAGREHQSKTRRELAALVDDEREGSRDNERSGDPQKPRFATRIDPRRSEEEDEECGPEAERDSAVRERSTGDLEC
jgi:hypothetical protein